MQGSFHAIQVYKDRKKQTRCVTQVTHLDTIIVIEFLTQYVKTHHETREREKEREVSGD